MESQFMNEALRQAKEALKVNNGPFGAVIVKNGEMIISARNVTSETNDPTAHAEVTAIREACKKLNTTDLSDAVLYTSCHPCPMCLSAAKWAKISKVVYCLSNEDTKAIGYDDWLHYQDVSKKPDDREMIFEQTMNEKGKEILIYSSET